MIQGLQAYHYSLRLQGPDCSKSSFFLFLAACRYKVLKPDKFAHFQQVALLICYARHIDPDPLASPPHFWQTFVLCLDSRFQCSEVF